VYLLAIPGNMQPPGCRNVILHRAQPAPDLRILVKILRASGLDRYCTLRVLYYLNTEVLLLPSRYYIDNSQHRFFYSTWNFHDGQSGTFDDMIIVRLSRLSIVSRCAEIRLSLIQGFGCPAEWHGLKHIKEVGSADHTNDINWTELIV